MHGSLHVLKPEPIDPLVRNEITAPSGIRFSVSCFAGGHWSLRNMYEKEDSRRYPDFALQLANAFASVGATNVYAPTPGFNGEILQRSNLTTEIHLPHHTYLHRNRDMPADGCPLVERGEAAASSAGGCGFAFATYGQDSIFAHGGRETILDRKEVLTQGEEKGRQRTFVDNLISAVAGECFDPRKLHVWPMYFINPDEFVHRWFVEDRKDHIAYNRAAIKYLPKRYPGECGRVLEGDIAIELDLARILRAQLVERDVPIENVHMEYSRLPKELPTTRNGGGAHGRYLVVAVRHTSPR